MRLSEKLQRDHECGDFGQALRGYAEEAASLESSVDELTRKAHGLCHAYGASLIRIYDLESALKRVLVISDRKHDAWDAAWALFETPKPEDT